MRKLPKLGKLYSHFPKWWTQAEPASTTPESFRPVPELSKDKEDETRFKKLAEIALHEHRGRRKDAA